MLCLGAELRHLGRVALVGAAREVEEALRFRLGAELRDLGRVALGGVAGEVEEARVFLFLRRASPFRRLDQVGLRRERSGRRERRTRQAHAARRRPAR